MVLHIGIGGANGGDSGYIYSRWGNQDVYRFRGRFLQCVGVRLGLGGLEGSIWNSSCVRVSCVNDLCIPAEGERNDVIKPMAHGGDQY